MNCYNTTKIENIINNLNEPDDVNLFDLSRFVKIFKLLLKTKDSQLILSIIRILNVLSALENHYNTVETIQADRIQGKYTISTYIDYLINPTIIGFDYIKNIEKDIMRHIRANNINIPPNTNIIEELVFQEEKTNTISESVKNTLLSLASIVNVNLFDFSKKLKTIFAFLYTCKNYICQYIDITSNTAIFNFLKNLLGPSIRVLGNYSVNAIVNFVFILCNTEDMLYYVMDKYSKEGGKKLGLYVSNTEIGKQIALEASKSEKINKSIQSLIPLQESSIKKKYTKFNKQFGIDSKESKEIIETLRTLPKRDRENLPLRLSENKLNIERALESDTLYIKKKEGSFEITSEEDLVNFMELLDISTNNDLDEVRNEILEYLGNVIRHAFDRKFVLEKQLSDSRFRNVSTDIIEQDLNNVEYILDSIRSGCDNSGLIEIYNNAERDSKTQISKETAESIKKFTFPMKKILDPTSELIKSILRKIGIREVTDEKILIAITSTLFIALYHIQNFLNNLKYIFRGVEDKLREMLSMSKIPGKKPVFKPMQLKLGLSGLIMIMVSNLIIFSPDIYRIMNMIEFNKFKIDEEDEVMYILGGQ
jgi:hypothetical protein